MGNAGPGDGIHMKARRPRIAAVVTEYRERSHAQHIVDGFLQDYGWNGRRHRPATDLVSLYVDQVPDGDLSRDRAARFPSMKIYPTIADALTLGGSGLAVDGILVIGEHGSYPFNDKGQHLLPRYEFFKQIVSVFRASCRTVPVFSDKHLSWNWEWTREMYDTSREMGFTFMAGSSRPVQRRIPPIDMPYGASVREAMCVSGGGVDGYDIHNLEAVQCMVERREGGEKGVKWLQAYSGDRFWEADHHGVWSRELFEAALSRSQSLRPSRPGFNNVFPTQDEMKRLVDDPVSNPKRQYAVGYSHGPVAYHYEHVDGLRCTMILLNGVVGDFNFAAHLEDRDTPLSTHMYKPGRQPNRTFFNPLVNALENMFLTGEPPYPVERTLLTTGLVAAGVESLARCQTRQETPHLATSYQPTRESTFQRT